MNHLRLTIKPISDPDCTFPFQRPSRMLLDVCGLRGELLRRVIDVRWDAAALFTWFHDNRVALCEAPPPQELEREGPIAVRIQAFYESADPDNTEALERVFAYRASHGLRFALRGVDVPDVYFGRLDSGYEVSCSDEAIWSYQFDLPEFLAEVERLSVE